MAVSGGVDSAAAAILLKEQGYNVIGATILMHQYSNTLVDDARKICNALKIDHIVIDAISEFRETVINNFVNEYRQGRTPNPCVLCNRELKWKSMIDMADKLGINKIATGHYASIKHYEDTDEYVIIKSPNDNKDQTYMLWRLPQEYLARTMFPIGNITSKRLVRQIAQSNGIPVFDKQDSQDICFIPSGDYRAFLQTFNDVGKGDIYLNGEKIGEHSGYPYYTTGQRRGLGIAYKEPLYVKEIDAANNRLIVVTADGLWSSGLVASNVNFMRKQFYDYRDEVIAKVRYRDSGKPVHYYMDGQHLVVQFEKHRKAVTPGQSVVLYSGGELLGGGVIC